MDKLWVYGCSFSCAFQDLPHLPLIEVEDGWPFKLAKKLNLELKHRARAGDGWNDIIYTLQKDLVDEKISKKDLIILSPSYFERLTFPELDGNKIDLPQVESLGPWVALGAKYSKDWSTLKQINITRFCHTLDYLSKLGYNIKGWCWTTTEEKRHLVCKDPNLLKVQKHLIPTPTNTLFWEDWILKTPECMLIPGKEKLLGGWTGDTHFGKKGHQIAADQFFTFISNIY